MTRDALVENGPERYQQRITIGPHVLLADEPQEVGGKDSGPNAQELVLAALAACVSTTVQLYADRKQWPLKGVQAKFRFVAAGQTPVHQIEMSLSLTGDLSEDQRTRIFAIAQRCPIHRLLTEGVEIRLT